MYFNHYFIMYMLLLLINYLFVYSVDDFCEFKASPLVPHKFDGAGSVGMASTPPTTQPSADPSDPYSALRDLAPPTSNDTSTQELLTINQEPTIQQETQQINQQQQQLPIINTDTHTSSNDGWADFASFPVSSKPMATSTDSPSNIINVMSPTPVVVGGGAVGSGPAGSSEGLVWSDDEFTEFSTYQSQDVSLVEPVLSSPSRTGGGGEGGGGGIVSPSPTSPISSTSTDSSKVMRNEREGLCIDYIKFSLF